MPVIREDVVKLTYDVDDREMVQAEDSIDKLISDTQKLGGNQCAGKAEDGLEDAAKAAQKLGGTKLDTLSSGLDKLATNAGKLAVKMGGMAVKGLAVGTAAAVTGVAALTGAAIRGYAEYEQLVGGVETLFGTGGMNLQEYAKSTGQSVSQAAKEFDRLYVSQKTVLTNANNAYRTAGMSANEYMETVTSFSASLIQSLDGDTQKAASLADQAIIDMADNANKMGTDIGMIQNAYAGFAKGNFTMLDNLKLGYGGTQEEMKRLLKDAEALSGKKFDISNFADIVEAIHIVQEEMGIAGTTAAEASDTIQGSALAMKAAWMNFLVGMADENADFDQLLDNLIDSVVTFTGNIIPRIKKTLPRLVRGLTEIGKTIGKELPGILQDLVPELAKGARQMLESLFDIVVECAPLLKTAGIELVKAIYEGFTGNKMTDEMLGTLTAKFDQAFEAFSDIASGVIDFTKELVSDLAPALLLIGDLLLDAFSWIGDNIDWILPVLGSLFGGLMAFKAVKTVLPFVKGFMGLFGKGGAGGASGGKGGASGGGFFSGFANLKPTTVLKGIGNIAIIVGGLMLLGAVVAKAAPYIAEMSDGKSLLEVLAIVAGIGLVGSGLSKLAGIVGKIPVATVAKGLANITIMVGGLTLVTAALAWVTSVMDFDFEEMLKLVGMIGVIGLVGSALAVFAGIVGVIPVPTVLLGLANIALALGGVTAVIAAFGALQQIDGFQQFLTQGGDLLAEVFRIIGEVAGSLIGGLAEGITNALPGIGENLSEFATSIKPMFDTFAGVDTEGLKNFAVALAALIAVVAGEQLVSVITGGINYAELGTNLSTMATNMSGFFSTIMSFPDGGFEKATALFDCLANISSLPKEGGVVGWFQGEVDFAKIATGLWYLGGTTSFFTAIQSIPEEAFTKASQLFDCLAGIKSLPKDGGVVGWFQGEVNFASIASGIQMLASAGMISALTTLSSIPAEAYTSLTAMFDALAGIKAMPKEGGIAGWFSGDSTTGLTNVASQLPGVATNIAAFFTNLGGLTDFTPIASLFNTLSNIKIDSDAADKGFLGLGSSQLETLGTGLSNFATNAKTFFTTVNETGAENIDTFFDSLGKGGELPEKLSGLDGEIGTALTNIVINADTKMLEIKTTLENGLTACITVFTTYSTNFYNSGAFMMDGLNNGILSKKATLISTANSIASAISRTIDNAMDINSPSKVTTQKGEYIGGGLAVGMTNSIPDIEFAANQISYASIPYSSSYTPDSDSGAIYTRGGDSEYITVSPTFNLTISGSQDDRVLARKVKSYVSQSIEEAFESLERKSYSYREA